MDGLLEKKYELLSQFSENVCPKIFLFKIGQDPNCFIEKVQKEVSFPFILKPNSGARGNGKTRKVKLIKNKFEAQEYLKNVREPVIAQEYINKPFEFGVFYVKLPKESCGRVTSFTQKNLFTLVGDGKSTIDELISNDLSRGIFYKESLYKNLKGKLQTVLKKNKKMIIEPIGSHCRGTEFKNIFHKITPKLEKTIDKISKQIPHFSYGRYDVKTDSLEDLENGNFKILELNTWYAEPIHFYDPDYKLWKAYRDAFWHINAMRKISLATKKNK